MIGTSSTEWILIRIAVIIFRYTPVLYCAVFVALRLFHGPSAWYLTLTKVIGVFLILEALFYISLWRRYRARLKCAAEHPPPMTPEERRTLFNRCFLNVASLESYLKWWFLGANLADIHRDNVRDFLLWAFFETDSESRTEDPELARQEVDGYIREIEKHLGRRLQAGRGPAKCLRLTLDSIDTTYRSLAWYTVIFLIDQATHLLLTWYGFQYCSSQPKTSDKTFPPRPQKLLAERSSPATDISYWFRPQLSSTGTPIVFLHGIGVGLLPYIRFLVHICGARKRHGKNIGIIAIEILPVSFRLTAPPLSKAEFLEQMTAILDRHGWEDFSVVSHSYGSVLTTHMLLSQNLRRKIVSVVLIDPVTVLLHMPDVAYNFTRRRPRKGNEWLLWYFASTDPGVAYCLGRHFFWRENIIWRDQLLARSGEGVARESRKVAVCLSGRDLIVDTATVAQYLAAGESDKDAATGAGATIDVTLFPELDHAQVFHDRASREKVVGIVRSVCAPTEAGIIADS